MKLAFDDFLNSMSETNTTLDYFYGGLIKPA